VRWSRRCGSGASPSGRAPARGRADVRSAASPKLDGAKLRSSRDPSQRTTAHSAWKPSCGGSPIRVNLSADLQWDIEQAFKELKNDLAIRPIYHQTDARIEAHILVAFLAYCLQVTLKQRLRWLAPGLTPRSVLDKMAATDGRAVMLSRYTEPEPDQALLLQQLKISLPDQPPPRIASNGIPIA
jgi:hypothetical protein